MERKKLLVDIPLRSVATRDVDIRVDERNPRKVFTTAYNGDTARITNKLCIKVLDDRSADDIYASWKIDDGAKSCCRAALAATAVTRGDGIVARE